MQLARRSGAPYLGLRQGVAARQLLGHRAAGKMSLARLPGEAGTDSMACAVEEGTALPVLALASALVDWATVLLALG